MVCVGYVYMRMKAIMKRIHINLFENEQTSRGLKTWCHYYNNEQVSFFFMPYVDVCVRLDMEDIHCRKTKSITRI